MKTLEKSNNKKLIVLTGTTCSGKTLTALNLSDLLKTEIISADSMLVYNKFDIGTAKPSKEILNRTKHHLIDIVEPDEHFDAWRYMQLGREVIDNSKLRNLIVVGGTQLYIKSLIEGLSLNIPKDDGIRENILKEVELKGALHVYNKLQELDPQGAASINPNDKQRIVRYLEINYITGLKVSEVFHSRSSERIKNAGHIKVGLSMEKDHLNQMIDERVDSMIARGLIDEVEYLRSIYSEDIKPFKGIGYKEICLYLGGNLKIEEAIALIKIRTKQFAKRQRTWLRKDKEIIWFDQVEDLIRDCIDYATN